MSSRSRRDGCASGSRIDSHVIGGTVGLLLVSRFAQYPPKPSPVPGQNQPAPLPDPFVDPLGGVALLLWQAFVFFDDLRDPLKVGANLWLRTSLPQAIPWGSEYSNIFFNVAQPIPSSRSTPRLLFSPRDTSSRTLVHHSMLVYTPLSSFRTADQTCRSKEAN